MKNLLLPICLISIGTFSFAQKDMKKDVKTKYLSLPTYDVSTVDPTTIVAEFAMDNATFGTEKLSDMQSTCVPKGGKLTDAIKVTTYYYQMKMNLPESYLVAKDGSGNVVYSSKTSEKGEQVSKYGYDKCENWVSETLKKSWAKDASSFKAKESKNYENTIYNKASEIAKGSIFLSFIDQEISVYGAKGKLYNYDELDNAFEKAISAYENIGSSGPNTADFNTLKECIATWEKELATIDLEDKKARITEEIGKGLHENCARAYMYMYDFDNAIKHGREFQKLWGNFHTNRTNDFDELMLKMQLQKIAVEKNQALMSDISALNAKANSSKGSSVKVNRLGSAEFGRLRGEDFQFRGSQISEIREDQKEEEEAAIASGELNPYQKYVNLTPPTGPSILMTMAPSALSGFPELTELPKEMCVLDLKQLIIRMNKIESVPADISKLQNLEKLDLTGNNLKTLPPEIGELNKLETLNLGKNPIESLPDEIGNCESLKSLNLKETNLSDAAKEKLSQLLPDCKIKY